MSENITIQIDGTPTALTVDKLNTKLSPSGSANWVPEDAFMVGTLKVWRNGTFKASDYGLFGFDKVLVENSTRGGKAATLVGGPHIGEIHAEAPAIKEGGKAILISDVHHLTVTKSDASRLSMMAEPLLTVEDITVTKKGTYTAYERGKYGFGEVTVNVPDSGGGGGGGGGTPTPPTSMRVTRLPDKWSGYADGEAIDYTGLEVTAYRDGKVWKNDDYPDGKIPLSELTLPVTNASLSDTSAIYTNGSITAMLVTYQEIWKYISYMGQDVQFFYSLQPLGEINGNRVSAGGGGMANLLFTKYNDNPYMALIRGNRLCNLYNLDAPYGSSPGAGTWIGSFDREGVFRTCPWPYFTMLPESTINPEGRSIDDLIQQPAIQNIPVNWSRAIDGETLSTSFDIVIEATNQQEVE